MALRLRLPDGSLLPIPEGGLHLGRGTPPGMFEHPGVSRLHVILYPLGHTDSAAARVEVVGANPVLLEVTTTDHTPTDVTPAGSYTISDVLDKGTSTVVGPGVSFYVASLRDATMCTLQLQPPPTAAGGAGANAAASPLSGVLNHTAAGGSAAAAAAAKGGAVGAPAKHPRSPAGATGFESSPDSSPRRSRRRQKLGAQQQAAAAAAAAGKAADGAPLAVSFEDSPMCLLHVRGLPHQVNSGALGVPLWHLVRGDFTTIFIENFMLDLPWLLSACPDIQRAAKVWIAHGESGSAESSIHKTAAAAHLGAGAAAAGVGPATRTSSSHSSAAAAAGSGAGAAGGGGGTAAAAAGAGGGGPGWCCWRPPLPLPWGTHHSKAFLLQYPQGLRVIITTANMIYGDCNNKTQGLWWQDFPPKGPGSPASSEFESDLVSYLRALQPPAAVAGPLAQLVQAHDLSSARVALLPSVPGYHTGAALHSYGHMRLRAVLARQHLPPRFAAAPLLAQCSSLGSLDPQWLLGEWGASLAAGQYGSTPATAGQYRPYGSTAGVQRSSNAMGAAGSSSAAFAHQQQQQQQQQANAMQRWLGGSAAAQGGGGGGSGGGAGAAATAPWPPLSPQQLYIVWPTVDEVRNSLEGWAAGVSIPGPQRNTSKPFLARHWCRWGGHSAGRQRAMPHIKSYLRFLPPGSSTSMGSCGGGAGGGGSSSRGPPGGTDKPPAGSWHTAAGGGGAAAAAAAGGGGAPSGGHPVAATGVGGSAPPPTDMAEVAWVVVTSHNLSKAAWGALQKGGSQLMVRSYELGVLLLPSLEEQYRCHPHRGHRVWPVPGEQPDQTQAAAGSRGGAAAAAQVPAGDTGAASMGGPTPPAAQQGALQAVVQQQASLAQPPPPPQQQQQQVTAAGNSTCPGQQQVTVRFWGPAGAPLLGSNHQHQQQYPQHSRQQQRQQGQQQGQQQQQPSQQQGQPGVQQQAALGAAGLGQQAPTSSSGAGAAPPAATASRQPFSPTTTTSSSSSPVPGPLMHQVVLPLPYTLPPQHYDPVQDQPWTVDEDYPGPDVLGRSLHDPWSLYGWKQPAGDN